MSIAYSFTSDASEPVPRVAGDPASGPAARALFGDPVAPELMQTVIDPVSSPVEQADFEMKTREMSAVDLEALGLATGEPASSLTTTDPGLPGVDMRAATEPARSSDLDIEVTGFESANGSEPAKTSIPTIIPTELSSGPVSPLAAKSPTPTNLRERQERQKTVALSEDDLEEVREAARAATDKPASDTLTTRPTPPKRADTAPVPPPLIAKEVSPEPLSVPEIDIQELAERSSESSGEIEVDMGDEPGPVTAVVAVPEIRRAPPSTPPPLAPSAAATNPGIAPPSNGPSQQVHAHPPPPPPVAQHKSPPTPPPAPAKKDPPRDLPKLAEKGPVPPAPSRTTTDTKPPMRGKPWFVELFDEDYLRTLPFLTPQATQAEAEFVIDAMSLTPGAQVLDVGCGYGRHAMELAARGYHVVGLDMSTPLLVRGGEEAHRRGLQINFVRGDMRELDFEAQFDAAYCLFSTFGYFDDETNKKTVANIARALKPGGRVLIEILNRDYIIADLPTRVWWEGDGCVVLEEVELNYFSSRIQVNRSVVFDDGRQLEQEISVRAYALHEVGKLMHAAGFRVLEVSGGYHTRGRFFGNQSRHIIVLAERKDSTPGS